MPEWNLSDNEKQERRTWNRITKCETRSRKISWSDGDLPYGEILSSENIIIYEIRWKNSKAMVSYYFFRPISSIFATSRGIFTIYENFVIF